VKKTGRSGRSRLGAHEVAAGIQLERLRSPSQTYIDSVGKQAEQQQATFRDVAAAQVKAWREAADNLRDVATKVAAARRADIDAALKQMKADASEAEARYQKLKQAGSESWATFGYPRWRSHARLSIPRQPGRVGRIEACVASENVKWVAFLFAAEMADPSGGGRYACGCRRVA